MLTVKQYITAALVLLTISSQSSADFDSFLSSTTESLFRGVADGLGDTVVGRAGAQLIESGADGLSKTMSGKTVDINKVEIKTDTVLRSGTIEASNKSTINMNDIFITNYSGDSVKVEKKLDSTGQVMASDNSLIEVGEMALTNARIGSFTAEQSVTNGANLIARQDSVIRVGGVYIK